jgi:hypothetical protein
LTENLNIQVNQPEDFPMDQFFEGRNKTRKNVAAKEKNDKLKKFLQNDRKVLRFYCLWDDRESMYGELREFVSVYRRDNLVVALLFSRR